MVKGKWFRWLKGSGSDGWREVVQVVEGKWFRWLKGSGTDG
jgi:hypothetical protein